MACRGLWELSQYSFKAAYQNETAMQFSDINSDGNGMLVVWIIFLFEGPIFITLAWYLEQVLDSGIGVRKHWLFPFRSCFKCASHTSTLSHFHTHRVSVFYAVAAAPDSAIQHTGQILRFSGVAMPPGMTSICIAAVNRC